MSLAIRALAVEADQNRPDIGSCDPRLRRGAAPQSANVRWWLATLVWWALGCTSASSIGFDAGPLVDITLPQAEAGPREAAQPAPDAARSDASSTLVPEASTTDAAPGDGALADAGQVGIADAAPWDGSALRDASAQPDTATSGGAFAAVHAEVISAHSCLGCHTTGLFPGTDLQLTDELPGGLRQAYDNLVNAPARAVGPCSGELLVVPFDCESSVLYRKLTLDPSCGLPMPPDRTVELRGEPAARVCEWIMAGAPF